MHVLFEILLIISLIIIPYKLGYIALSKVNYSKSELNFDFMEIWALGLVMIISLVIIYVSCRYAIVKFLEELYVQLN